MRSSNKVNIAGFTLIELSIVLVIIGLITGGVLVGRDLIRGAAVRSTLSQLEKYKVAVNAFRLKYGAMPGDILSSDASSLGFYNVTGTLANTLGCGDANGIIQGWNTGSFIAGGNLAGEVLMFWLHLSQAKFIGGMYGAGGANVTLSGATVNGGSYNGLLPPSVTVDSTFVNEILPRAKINDNVYFTVGNVNKRNVFVLSAITKVYKIADTDSTNGISPADAYSIDLKIDDGKPSSGIVYALDAQTNFIGSGDEFSILSANNCINSGAYFTNDKSYADLPNCSLRFDF